MHFGCCGWVAMCLANTATHMLSVRTAHSYPANRFVLFCLSSAQMHNRHVFCECIAYNGPPTKRIRHVSRSEPLCVYIPQPMHASIESDSCHLHRFRIHIRFFASCKVITWKHSAFLYVYSPRTKHQQTCVISYSIDIMSTTHRRTLQHMVQHGKA